MLYTDVDALRADHPEITVEVLDAEAAERLIEKAEDLIDELLGARSVDDLTGRKVDPDALIEWRAVKLERATNLAAKFLFQNPDWELEQRYTSVGGDQSVAGPYGSPFPGVMALLNASGLRQLTTRATSGTGGNRDEVIGNLPEPD